LAALAVTSEASTQEWHKNFWSVGNQERLVETTAAAGDGVVNGLERGVDLINAFKQPSIICNGTHGKNG
jgi:hypothetical protein